MKKCIALCLLSITLGLSAQKQQITLEEIWSGAFSTEGIASLRSLQAGDQYTTLENNEGESQIVVYDYKSMSKQGVLLSSGTEIPRFSSYAFNQDESKILIATQRSPIFRRSSEAVYYVFDRIARKLIQVDSDKIKVPAFSPNGTELAYIKENNLYLFDLQSLSSKQLTTDGAEGSIINGHADWVYEEEFSLVRAYAFNASGSHITYLKFDESEVPEFSMDVYGQNLYPYPYRFKYPKAGEKNADVSVYLIDLKSGAQQKANLEPQEYTMRIYAKNEANKMVVQTLNRHQNHLMLHEIDLKSNTSSVLLEEKDEAYIDIHDNLTFLENDDFIWTSEADGYNHLYLYNADGSLKNQLTSGDYEVTAFYGYDATRKRLFYQSTEPSSIERAVYRIAPNGRFKTRITQEAGTYSAQFSADYTYFITTYESATTPPEFSLRDSGSGKLLSVIKDNQALLKKLDSYELSPKEYGTLRVGNSSLNMYMIRPANFDPNKQYPLLMFQYSGPGSQQVADRWMGTNDYWHQMLAQQGYVIACVDPRGTGFRGRDFKKVTYLNLVKLET